MTKAVQLLNISKHFGDVIANNNVSLEIDKGEIYGLVGENGAGKTTLMNILSGMIQPDSGEIFIYEKKVSIQSPHQALAMGIGMVYQHFMLSPSLTVLENVILGKEPSRFGLIDSKGAERRIEEIIKQYFLTVDLHKKVYELSVGEMQRVEILKALYRGAEILILDEPTAVLTPQDTKELFKVLKGMKQRGQTIIFITHKLKEVLAITDRVTVMQHGVVTGVLQTKDTSEQQLACLMVGREVVLRIKKSKAHIQGEVLKVSKLSAKNDRGLPALKNVDFNLHEGEILGIAGVEGNGQSELVQVLNGLRRPTAGSISFNGINITKATPRQHREKGISHIPEDRLRLGVETQCTLEENVVLTRYYQSPFSQWIFLNIGKIQRYAQELVDRFNITASSTHLQVGALSGGNIQKLILAREMDGNPNVLIAAQPTRGVDVGSIEYIHKCIIALRDDGHAVLLVSAELEEIMTLSDRILVMYEGEIVGEFLGQKVSEEELGMYMAGAKRMQPIQGVKC